MATRPIPTNPMQPTRPHPVRTPIKRLIGLLAQIKRLRRTTQVGAQSQDFGGYSDCWGFWDWRAGDALPSKNAATLIVPILAERLEFSKLSLAGGAKGIRFGLMPLF